MGLGCKASKHTSIAVTKDVNCQKLNDQLCRQNNSLESDMVRCPDSICVIRLKDPSLVLIHSLFGSGPGNGNYLNLIRIKFDTSYFTDTLYWTNADDLYRMDKLIYDDSLDWFSFVEEGGGTNHYSETQFVIRIANDRFVELLNFPLFVSDVDPEVTPMTFNSVKSTLLTVAKDRIVMRSIFESGIIENEQAQSLFSKVDTVTFDYSISSQQFIWKSSTNADFQKIWIQGLDYQFLR